MERGIKKCYNKCFKLKINLKYFWTLFTLFRKPLGLWMAQIAANRKNNRMYLPFQVISFNFGMFCKSAMA